MDVAPLPYLNILTCLPTAVWLYDQRARALVWGNPKALDLWEVSSQEEFREHCFSYLTDAALQTIESYTQQFEHEFKTGCPLTPHTDVWTVYPKDKPVPIRCTLTGIPMSFREMWCLTHQGHTSPPPSDPSIPDSQMYILCQSLIPKEEFVAKELRSKEALRNTVANISIFTADSECLLENPAAMQTYNNAPLHARFVESSVINEILNVTTESSVPYQDYLKMHTSNMEEGVRWFSVDARKIHDPVTGNNVVLLHTTDVHEFRKSQFKLSRVEEVAKIGTWECDPHTGVMTCSPQFFRHFGCDPNRARITFQEMLSLIHPDDVAHVSAAHANHLKGIMGTGEIVMHVVTGDQTPPRTVLLHVECLTDLEGRVTKLVGSCQDVSLLSTYAENLQTAEELVKAVISQVHAGLVATNALGQLTLVNRNARQLHGISDEDDGIPDFSLLLSCVRDLEDQPMKPEDTPLQRALAGEPVRDEHMKIIPLGKSIEEAVFVSCSGQLLLKPDGSKLGAVVSMQNITAHKMAEKALRAAKEEAELASKLKSEFMANLSHEIRTPFNGILGMLSLALETDIPPMAREHLESALECTHFLLNIINTLLDFSKLETKHVELCPVPFLLRSSVGTILSLFETHAREKKVTLQLEVEADVPDSLFGDVDRLRQIVTHLVDNSIKFSKPPGRIAVHIELAPEQSPNPNFVELFFKVIDNGIGIPEEKMKHLFGSFYQVDGSSTRQQGGVGLGLAICENLVSLFGGKIWCSSTEGKGSTFYFTVHLERPSSKYHDKYTFRHRRSISSSVIEGHSPPTQNYASSSPSSHSSPPLPPSLSIVTNSSPTSSPSNSPRPTSPISFSPGAFAVLRSSAPSSLRGRMNSSDGVSPRSPGTPPPLPSSPLGREGYQIGKEGTSPSFPFTNLLPSLLPAYANNAYATFPPAFDRRRFSYAGPPTNFSPVLNSSPRHVPSQLRILLCEDNVMNQKVMVRMLAKYGHQITIANDGREGVAIFERTDPKNRFECVLMDMQMPHMNGCEAAVRIRTIEKERGLPYTPIIAVSAYVEEKDKFGEAGIDCYLSKPINQPALLETMYELTLRYKVDNIADSTNHKEQDDNNNNNNNNNDDNNDDNNNQNNDNNNNLLPIPTPFANIQSTSSSM